MFLMTLVNVIILVFCILWNLVTPGMDLRYCISEFSCFLSLVFVIVHVSDAKVDILLFVVLALDTVLKIILFIFWYFTSLVFQMHYMLFLFCDKCLTQYLVLSFPKSNINRFTIQANLLKLWCQYFAFTIIYFHFPFVTCLI